MLNENNFASAQSLLDGIGARPNVKRVRREAGLIERKQDDEKVILMEDNRQVLFG